MSMVLNMVGGISDKTVYSGTITVNDGYPPDGAIETGITISEDAIFILIPQTVYHPLNSDEYFTACRISKNFSYVSRCAIYTDNYGNEYGTALDSVVSQTENWFVLYEGSKVWVSHSSFLLSAGTYEWYLLQ